MRPYALLISLLTAGLGATVVAAPTAKPVDTSTVRHKVWCGYQGWFRCPGDSANLGWSHWSRSSDHIAPNTLTFDLWPDMAEYGADERYPAPSFTYPDGKPAQLFSSTNPATVLRHFQWMQQYGIDGAFLQHFAVDLPGGLFAQSYPSRMQVMRNVIQAADKTGRAWAIAYDTAGMPIDRIYDVVTEDWKRLVDTGVAKGRRYVREHGKPVVMIWGFYRNNTHDQMTPQLGNRLIEFFHQKGKYGAFLIGGGDWDWRQDADWVQMVLRFDGYCPWNVGNFSRDANGVTSASIHWWADDKALCDKHNVFWLPVVYPGFSWDNLTLAKPGTSKLARRDGAFLREQFQGLRKLNVDCAYVAMFDEVDEGTAIFKVTNHPPTQAHFITYDDLPTDTYLRITGEGAKLIKRRD